MVSCKCVHKSIGSPITESTVGVTLYYSSLSADRFMSVCPNSFVEMVYYDNMVSIEDNSIADSLKSFISCLGANKYDTAMVVNKRFSTIDISANETIDETTVQDVEFDSYMVLDISEKAEQKRYAFGNNCLQGVCIVDDGSICRDNGLFSYVMKLANRYGLDNVVY